MSYIKAYLVILSIMLLMVAGIVVDNQIRGSAGINSLRHDLQGLGPLIMSADTAVNNSARYIRHRSLAYPGSAFPDFPGQQDYLPAGMAWSPVDFPGLDTRLYVGDSPVRK